MEDHELLSKISEMMDQKLDERFSQYDQKLDERFSQYDQKLDERFLPIYDTLNTLKFKQEHMSDKLKGIEVTMNYNHYHLSHDIKKLQEDVETITEILKINNMIPIS